MEQPAWLIVPLPYWNPLTAGDEEPDTLAWCEGRRFKGQENVQELFNMFDNSKNKNQQSQHYTQIQF